MGGKKLICALAALMTALLLTSCNAEDVPVLNNTAPKGASNAASQNVSAEYDAFRKDRIFPADLPDEALKKPSEEITSLDDFIYALDYMAFYRIGDTVWFGFSKEYSDQFYNPYTEFQKAYRMADLADVYACRMDDSYYSKYGMIGVKYSMSRDIASVPAESVPDTPVVQSFDYELIESAAPLVIASDDQSLIPISCENGEQLYYLVMNGYRPMPKDSSIAEGLYDSAKDVLSACIRDGQSDFEKIKAVYDWLTTEVVYDSQTAYSKDTYLVKEQAYYLEGVFFNHCAVCDGKAKACALLLNMAGIDCVRTTGVSGRADHAWNMVKLEDKWYNLCATYGQSNMSSSIGRIVPNYSMLLSSRETGNPQDWGYEVQKHLDIYEQLEEDAYDIYSAMSDLSGANLNVKDIEEFNALMLSASACEKEEYKFEFRYTGEDSEGFRSQLIDLLESEPGVNATEVKREGGEVYQVIVLNGR